MFGDLGAGKLVMIIESDIFDCFAQVFDAAKQGILLGIKIFSDSGKNGRDQQIEKVIVLKSRLIQASLQFADERRDVSRIGKLDYLNRKYAYDSAMIQAQIAKYNLLQAIQSYEWVLNGLANAS